MPFLPTFEPDANQPLDVAAARESLALRARQSIHSVRTVAIAAVLTAAGFSLVSPVWRLVAWALPVIVMAYVNARVCERVLEGVETASVAELGARQRTLLVMTLINQTLMGSTVWWVSWDNVGAATVATTLQLIYLGGALINASTHPPTFLAGAWINLGMAALYWATHSAVGIPLAFALLGVGLVLTKFARQVAADFRDSLRMRFENRELLAQLAEEKKAAEEANAAKSRFLAAASHDLRQPLHALLVFSSLLGRNAKDPSALIGPIREAAAALDKLFNGLLDISKLETGSVVPQFQAVNVQVAAQELVREYSAACAERGIAIRVEGETAWALSDPFLLERILRNLIDNAVKYTAEGEIVVNIGQGPSVVEVAVRDTGVGIDPAMRDSIFEEYFQLDNPSRDPARGTGLGLAIVRRLSELLAVPVQVDSQPGRGSVFSLQLPKAPLLALADGGVAPVDPSAPPVQGARVWLVEDNDLVRTATSQALQVWGCVVQAWPGMPQAHEWRDAAAPDALIVDFRLSHGATGLDVIRALRQRWPSLPVAIMTGDPQIERSRFDDLERVTLMQKPVMPEVLVKWLAGARSADAHAVARGDVDGLGAALHA